MTMISEVRYNHKTFVKNYDMVNNARASSTTASPRPFV